VGAIAREPARQPAPFLDSVHPEDGARVLEVMDTDRRSGFDITYRIVRPDGSLRWIRDRGFPVKNDAGEVYRMAEDMGEQRNAEQQKEDQSRLVINAIPTTAWSILPDGKVDFVNQPYLDYTGLSFDEAMAQPDRPIHPEDMPAVMGQWSAAMASGAPFKAEMRLRRADGEYRWFVVRTVPLRDEQGRIVRWYGSSTDIEDWKRAQDAARHAAGELQALSRRLVELQEAERRSLARELHDRLGATLTALSVNLAILRERSRGDAVATARIDDSAALVKSTAAAYENIVSDLRPPMLDQHGLAAALEWYGRQFGRRVGVAVSVQSAAGGRVAPEVETALFRIAQEALTNVAKHADAEHVAITLCRTNREFLMAIADDGVGFRPGAPAPERGLGLVTMRERAQAVGGAFSIEPLPDGTGTRLTVRVPA
jgi:PAS domain S-box-containing protein